MQWLVLKALQAFLTARLADMLLRRHGAGNDEAAPPQVVIGVDKPKQLRPKVDFPFVALVPGGLKLGAEMNEIGVSMVCGVWTAEKDPEAGVHELLNLLDRIIMEIQTIHAVDDRYVPVRESTRVLNDPTPRHPYYLAEIITTWSFMAPKPPPTF